jgi:coproporphyrinogen III oxidase-like Fe-S oxidoreductase
MKRTERIALLLRTRDGVAASELKRFGQETSEFRALGLLRKSGGTFLLTRKGKSLADSVAEAFLQFLPLSGSNANILISTS